MTKPQSALIVIDLQNDFCPNGALAVAGGDEIVSGINGLMGEFGAVILTQDWHPADHSSFADNHSDAAPYSLTQMPYGPQVLWPRHCVQGTPGADFHPALRLDPANLVIRKGYNPAIDSYSAFFENDRTTATGLHGYLQDRGITEITLAGLATDFCVAFSALDGARLGYKTSVRMDLSRGIDLDGSMAAMADQMRAAGILLVGL